eukprot:3980369-Pleurochrysis_carterae.AAC.1
MKAVDVREYGPIAPLEWTDRCNSFRASPRDGTRAWCAYARQLASKDGGRASADAHGIAVCAKGRRCTPSRRAPARAREQKRSPERAKRTKRTATSVGDECVKQLTPNSSAEMSAMSVKVKPYEMRIDK